MQVTKTISNVMVSAAVGTCYRMYCVRITRHNML